MPAAFESQRGSVPTIRTAGSGLATVGVVVPLFGNVGYMRECLTSLAKQTIPFDEVVLVDDATGDPAVTELLVEWTDRPGWHAISLESNLGIVGATNAGIEASGVDYLAFVDCDDVLHPRASETVRRHLAARPVDLLATGYATFEVTPDEACDAGRLDMRGIYPSESALILEHLYLSHLKVASRGFLARVGGFRAGTDGVQDWHLAVDAVLTGTTSVIEEVLYFHRVHAQQTTHTARSDFLRSVNTRRASFVEDLAERQARTKRAVPALAGLARMLQRGEHDKTLGLLLCGGQAGLAGLPGSVSWWDRLAASGEWEWIAFLGGGWLDIGGLQTALREPGTALIGMVVSKQLPTSVLMARWYSGYLDFVVVLDAESRTALYDSLPEGTPLVIDARGDAT